MKRPRSTAPPASGAWSTSHSRCWRMFILFARCFRRSGPWAIFPRSISCPAARPPALTDVLATYGFHEAFDFGYPNLGVAAMMSALPLLIPLVILLMRRIRVTGVQL